METKTNDLERGPHLDADAARSAAQDPELERLRAKVQDTIATTKKAISDGVEQVQRRANGALRAVDHSVRDQPWEAIGIAAIAGLAIGFLAGRR